MVKILQSAHSQRFTQTLSKLAYLALRLSFVTNTRVLPPEIQNYFYSPILGIITDKKIR